MRTTMAFAATLILFEATLSGLRANARTEPVDQAEVPALLARIDHLLSSAGTEIRAEPARWPELETFHENLWRALALDPIQGISADERQSEALTQSLDTQLAELVASPVVARLGAREELSEYASKCQELIELRKRRLYREARKYARSGGLDKLYDALTTRIQNGSPGGRENALRMSVILSADLDSRLRDAISRLHRAASAPDPDPDRAPIPSPLPAPEIRKNQTTRSLQAVRPLSPGGIALLVANLLWMIVSISAFFLGRSTLRKSSGPTATPLEDQERPNPADWAGRYEQAVAILKRGRLRDQELIRKLNSFSWDFSQFFVRYHLDEPLSNVERFRREIEELSEALKQLVARTQNCVSASERGLAETVDQLRELSEPAETSRGDPPSKGESFAA